MLTLSTRQTTDSVYQLGLSAPVIGTAMLGRELGMVRRATLIRTGKREEILDDAQSLRLLLITNPGWSLEMEVAFDAHVTPPGLLEPLTLPMLAITGRVMEGAAVSWVDGGERGLTFSVSQWDSLERDSIAYRTLPGGGATPISLTMDYDGDLISMDATWPTVDAE